MADFEAAEAAGLESGYAYVHELGNHAVTYTVRGLVTDATQLLQAQAQLRAAVLDTLHDAEIEIVSPVFEMGRPLAEGTVIIPDLEERPASGTVQAQPDHIIFDRAEAEAGRSQRTLQPSRLTAHGTQSGLVGIGVSEIPQFD